VLPRNVGSIHDKTRVIDAPRLTSPELMETSTTDQKRSAVLSHNRHCRDAAAIYESVADLGARLDETALDKSLAIRTCRGG
jgi:hypothetical protein